MNTLEDKLTAALRETGEEIAGESIRPLVLDPPRYRPRVRGGASRRRWLARLTPLAAAAAVAAVIAASLAISATFHGRIHAAEPGAGRAGGAPAGGPGALRKVPPYYVSLSGRSNTYILGGQRAQIRATTTGAVLATIRPPRPFSPGNLPTSTHCRGFSGLPRKSLRRCPEHTTRSPRRVRPVAAGEHPSAVAKHDKSTRIPFDTGSVD